VFVRIALASAVALWVLPAMAAEPPAVPELVLESASGNSSIEFHLAVQMQWLGLRRDTGTNAVGEFGLYFRRLRPVIGGHLLGEELTYRLHLSTLPGSLELMDLWADYRFHPQARVRVGQMKVPFTRWRLNSYLTRPSIGWSYGSRYFGAERQLGAMIHNNTRGPAGLEYQVGVFDGVNARGVHGVGTALVYKEPRPNSSDLTDPDWRRDLHAEGVAHVAYNAGGIDVSRPTDFAGGPLRWSVGLSGAWDIDPTAKQDMRLRIAPEAAVAINHFTATGVFYLGFFDPVASSGTHQLGLVGGLVQTSYLLTEHFELALKFSTVRILRRLRRDARDAANEVLAAVGAHADNLEIQYADVGDLRAENELDITFNVYALAGVLKLQVEGAWFLHERLADNRYDYALRVQAQLAF